MTAFRFENELWPQGHYEFFDMFRGLAGFSQSPIYASRNALRNSKGFVCPLHPTFTCTPLNNTRLSDEHSADCPVAQVPEFGELSYGVMPLERRCQIQPVRRSSAG